MVAAIFPLAAQTVGEPALNVGSNTLNEENWPGAIGSSNNVQGLYSLAVGSSNGIVPEASGAGCSLVIGDGNSAAGNRNFISGSQNCSSSSNSGSIGQDLVNFWDSSTIIGLHNATTMAPDSGLLFAIGNGADSLHRANAFEVYISGKILMPRQGDILMGEFGNPE